MIDRVDCPAKQRDRIRMGTVHYSGNTPTGSLGSPGFTSEQGSGGYPSGSYPTRPWSAGSTGNSGPLPIISSQNVGNGWTPYQDSPLPPQDALDEDLLSTDEPSVPDESYDATDYQQSEGSRQNLPYSQAHPSGPLGPSNTGPLGYSNTQQTSTTGHMPAISPGGSNTIVQSTVVQSTVDLNMLMDIIETVFDRPTISTFVLMTGDKDFTRISARLKLRLNKTVIVVGIPGTVSRDLISSANQFVPLVPGGPASSGITGNTGALPVAPAAYTQMPSGTTGSMPAIGYSAGSSPVPQVPFTSAQMDVLDPQFLQFLDYI